MLKLLALGDVFGSAAQTYLYENLERFKRENGVDFCVVNGENADGPSGCEEESLRGILASGADVVTGGNHTLRRPSAKRLLSDDERFLRPANFPQKAHGTGYTIRHTGGGIRVLTVNLIGRVSMGITGVECPFEALDKILSFEKGNYDVAAVDLHAEATSEKIAFAYAFEGKVSAIWGTHTHVPTADERLIGGTGFITDIGMTGPEDSVIGVLPQKAVERFRLGKTDAFLTAQGPVAAHGALFTIGEDGRCLSVVRVTF